MLLYVPFLGMYSLQLRSYTWLCHTCIYALHISIPLSHPYVCSDGLVCDEPFCEVISVSLHMSVITQNGDSPLMMAVRWGVTEAVSLLVKAGANLDLQNKVICKRICIRWFDFREVWLFRGVSRKVVRGELKPR